MQINILQVFKQWSKMHIYNCTFFIKRQSGFSCSKYRFQAAMSHFTFHLWLLIHIIFSQSQPSYWYVMTDLWEKGTATSSRGFLKNANPHSVRLSTPHVSMRTVLTVSQHGLVSLSLTCYQSLHSTSHPPFLFETAFLFSLSQHFFLSLPNLRSPIVFPLLRCKCVSSIFWKTF